MIATAPFGSTGHASSRLIFGAAALGWMGQDDADETLSLIHSSGVNHIDTAASYGESEVRLKPWLASHRDGVFLATKTGERGGDAARAQLEVSLSRMGVDQVDLIQLHNLVEEGEWETAFGPGGAVEALARARDEGLVRFIGVTGHGLRIPGMHLRSLDAFPFDSVLFPFSAVLLRDPDYRADVERLREVCRSRGVATQTIKAIARRRWQPDDESRRLSWYEPLRDLEVIDRAMRFVLTNDDLFLNTTSDATLLPDIFAIAARLEAPVEAPDPAAIDADIDAHMIESIFDGGALERI